MAIPSTLKKMGPPVRATALVGSRESRLMAKAKFFLFFFFSSAWVLKKSY